MGNELKSCKRRTATERQVKYANGISEKLELGVWFTVNDSYYEVSKFIRKHEDEYKNISRKATASIRQVDYANGISEVCGLSKRFSISDPYVEVCEFIQKNKEQYDKLAWKKSIQNCDKEGSFSKETMEFICDNLYKKHGLYCFLGEEDEIIYIGKSVDLSQRITTSFRERKSKAEIKKIMYMIEDNMADVNILEILLIAENKPLLNTESNTDDVPKRYKSGVEILVDFKELPY